MTAMTIGNLDASGKVQEQGPRIQGKHSTQTRPSTMAAFPLKVFRLASILFPLLVQSTVFASSLPANVSSSSGVQIINHLNATIFAWSVSDDIGPMQTLNANGGSYMERWLVRPEGGISIKLSIHPDMSEVMQFEYTVSHADVYWDVSFINLPLSSPLFQAGFSAMPVPAVCSSAACAPNDRSCRDVYFQPYDDYAVRKCPRDVALTVHLGSVSTGD